MRIAILEDDVTVAQLYQHWLNQEGHSYRCYTTGKEFLKAISRESFDLAILDWELPDTTGTEVLKDLRKQLDWPIPVLFATNRNDEQDIVYALRAGADDYMIKPVKQQELLARLMAVGRRLVTANNQEEPLASAPYSFDSATLTVCVADDRIQLTRKELELTRFLFRNADRLLSRGHILESVWGQSAELNTRTVDTHVSAIRQKLQISPDRGWRLASIYGYGYRLEKVKHS